MVIYSTIITHLTSRRVYTSRSHKNHAYAQGDVPISEEWRPQQGHLGNFLTLSLSLLMGMGITHLLFIAESEPSCTTVISSLLHHYSSVVLFSESHRLHKRPQPCNALRVLDGSCSGCADFVIDAINRAARGEPKSAAAGEEHEIFPRKTQTNGRHCVWQ